MSARSSGRQSFSISACIVFSGHSDADSWIFKISHFHKSFFITFGNYTVLWFLPSVYTYHNVMKNDLKISYMNGFLQIQLLFSRRRISNTDWKIPNKLSPSLRTASCLKEYFFSLLSSELLIVHENIGQCGYIPPTRKYERWCVFHSPII